MIAKLLSFVKFLIGPDGKLFIQAVFQFAAYVHKEMEHAAFKDGLKQAVEIAKRNKDPRKFVSVFRRRT